MTMRLSAVDRSLFDQIAHAARANPFGRERAEIDARAAGMRAADDRGEVVDRLLARLQTRLRALGALDVRACAAEDREAVELTLLFHAFHRYAPELDAHIQAQLARPGRPPRLACAREFLQLLVGYGFSAEDAVLSLAMSFQMRRAFYFIEHTLPGRSASMRKLRESLWNNVLSCDVRVYARRLWRKMEDFSTFVLGETGVGKGTAAAAIGRSCFIPFDEKREAFAESFAQAFTTLNLSQFPATLLESELFGHRKGAFTGAVEDHPGALGRTSPHGAIFLDEIGEIDVPVQIKLLHVLQDRRYTPLGSHEPRRFEGRVIAATNRPLDELRRAGRMRDDFYYRLCSDVIEVPSLRERIAEDPAELDVLLATIVRRTLDDDAPDVRAMVRDAIARDLGDGYAWPGNVRELEQVVRRVLLRRSCAPDFRATTTDGDTAEAVVARHCMALYRQLGSYEAVSRKVGLDRRTVKKYILQS